MATRIKGRFYSERESNTERIAVRVPPSVYLSLIDASNGQIPQFVRQAIIEKIERETTPTR